MLPQHLAPPTPCTRHGFIEQIQVSIAQISILIHTTFSNWKSLLSFCQPDGATV